MSSDILFTGLMMLIPALLIILCVLFSNMKSKSEDSVKTHKMTLRDGKGTVRYRLNRNYTFMNLILLCASGMAALEYMIDKDDKKVYLVRKETFEIDVDTIATLDEEYINIEITVIVPEPERPDDGKMKPKPHDVVIRSPPSKIVVCITVTESDISN